MRKDDLIETLEQINDYLRFYASFGIQTVDIKCWPGDPVKLTQALARYMTAEGETSPTAAEVAPVISAPRIEPEKPPPVEKDVAGPPAQLTMAPVSELPPPPPVTDEVTAPKKAKGALFDWQPDALGTKSMKAKAINVFAMLPPNDTMETVRESLGDCRRCKLCKTRKTIVFGSGTPKAELMLIGEGPGADEDEQGLPFVGRAGQLLTKILEAIHLTREQVYITNVVKCRPPNNRKPEPDEVDPCEPFLLRQINVIKPKLICALGGTAAQALLKTKEGITMLRGRFFDFHGYPLIPTFHPAYLLRNPADKRLVWEDMQKIRDYLQGKIER